MQTRRQIIQDAYLAFISRDPQQELRVTCRDFDIRNFLPVAARLGSSLRCQNATVDEIVRDLAPTLAETIEIYQGDTRGYYAAIALIAGFCQCKETLLPNMNRFIQSLELTPEMRALWDTPRRKQNVEKDIQNVFYYCAQLNWLAP